MIDFFEGSNIEKLIQCIFAHIKTQVENPRGLKWFYTRSNHAFTHQLLQVCFSIGARQFLYRVAIMDRKKVDGDNTKNTDEQCFK